MDLKLTEFDTNGTMFNFCNDEGMPLIFYLHSDTEDNFYTDLLNECFAQVADEPKGHAMVLAWPKDCTYTNAYIPAFDIKYIEDCFKLKKYPNPANYIIQTSCASKYSKADIYNCWYYRKKSWYNIKPVPGITITSAGRKISRLPFTDEEDIAIVKYILMNNCAFKVSQNNTWIEMENSKICELRSWRSLKQRYMKYTRYHIISRIAMFPFITPKNVKVLQKSLALDTMRDKERIKRELTN